MIIPRRVALPYPSFLTAWLALDLGEPPTALLPGRPVAQPGRTLDEVTGQAWADLAARGLAAGRELDDALADTLRLLASAATRYYAFFHQGDGDTRSVLVAGSKVVAAVDGGTVTLRPSPSDSGARALVAMLPELPGVPGEALSAPAGELSRPSGTAVLTEVRPTGRASTAARMRWLLAQPRTGGGQLYAARRDRPGHYQVCDQPQSYVDIAAGRILATEHKAGDGTVWRSLIPAEPPLLMRRLEALLPR